MKENLKKNKNPHGKAPCSVMPTSTLVVVKSAAIGWTETIPFDFGGEHLKYSHLSPLFLHISVHHKE
jgi:hypothetical protein